MVELLRELSNLNGVSGHEDDVRKYIIDNIEPYADYIKIDNLGNIISFKRGKNSKKTILLSAHMDEIGFIVSEITDNGFVKFKAVGDVDSRYVVSKCVKINNKVDGVLGMKAIHLQKREERQKTVSLDDLYIDIGAQSKKKALKRVSLGDYVSFTTKFEDAGEKVWGKAFESRVGCACLIELMQKDYDNDVYFIFTAQREVGMRGASVASYGLDIDEALVLEGCESADMYGCKPNETAAKLGDGVCIDFMDKYAILNKKLTAEFKNSLKQAGIAVQDKKSAIGLTDAGALQKCCDGTVTACIALPVRYAHTPAGMAAKSDIEAMKQAAELFIERSGEQD